MKFTYNSGQRPLDGYTLKRGIGRGGFGEVYYALSDGGKEVALKLVSGNQEVELRGMAQCLNLKHPNLVSLFDIKTDATGDHWVLMEYIAGEPLSVVLNRHPQGLPPELAQQWFITLAKSVGYLHEHGIVHRDLKPGNIFIENGFVKIGDYGLSKFMSSSQRNAQTQSVGTVYYMAPEISTGNYNKQIDIYAAGVILYEMLTGHVPFEGESAGEILMKHLTSPPDLSKVSAPFVSILGRALAKNPAHRYGSMAEMAREVEICLEPTRRPVAAARPIPAAAKPQAVAAAKPEEIPCVLPAPTTRGLVTELTGSLALSAVLSAAMTGVLGLFSAAVGQAGNPSELLVWLGSLFFLTVAVCWAVLIPAKFWSRRLSESWSRRLVMLLLGVAVGAAALWINGWSLRNSGSDWDVLHWQGTNYLMAPEVSERHGLSVGARYLSYFALALFALRWWRMADRHRSHRFSFFPVLAAGVWAVLLLFVWPWQDAPSAYGAVALVLAAVVIQLSSPWEPLPQLSTRRVRLRYA